MARQYKLARKMKKIALTAAAKEPGVSQPTLSSWESERKAPSIEGLIRMSEYYHVSTDFLLGLTTESDPRKDWIEPVDPSVLPALHETPVYVPEKGWAFIVDIVNALQQFGNDFVKVISDKAAEIEGANVESGLSIHGAEAANSRSRVETWVRKRV